MLNKSLGKMRPLSIPKFAPTEIELHGNHEHQRHRVIRLGSEMW